MEMVLGIVPFKEKWEDFEIISSSVFNISFFSLSPIIVNTYCQTLFGRILLNKDIKVLCECISRECTVNLVRGRNVINEN